MGDALFQRVAILGVGLIGGSLARAIRRGGLAGEIVGGGRDAAHLRRATELGVIDSYSTDLAQAVAGADLVVLAMPVGGMAGVMARLAEHLPAEAIITDVGSVKGCVVDAAREVFGEVPARLVPGHPIAGTERSGVEASFDHLFDGKKVILTPLQHTDREALARVDRLWREIGADVVHLEVAHHDEVLAATSHLPHVLAYALVDTLAGMQERTEIFEFAAGGFRDFTRIASSDPGMWHDICLANKDALLSALRAFSTGLGELEKALEKGDSEYLHQVFSRAKSARDNFNQS